MKSKTVNILLYILSAALFISGAYLLIRQYVLIPGAYSPPPISTPGPPVTTTPEHTPAGSLTPEITPAPTEYVKPIPIRIYFTDREIMADIVPVGKVLEGEKAGQMDTVDSAELAAWYMYGSAPGEPGNAIINGHVRWKGVKGTFSILPDLEIGEEVVILFEEGYTVRFFVESVNIHDRLDEDLNKYMELGGEARLTLITCHGDFDSEAHTSEERCVVICKPAPEAGSKIMPNS